MPGSQARIEDLSDDRKRKSDDAPKKASSSAKRSSSTSGAKQENELRQRLTDCFDRIAESLDNRGDEELAEIVRDDAEVMAGGLVFMTRPIAVLRLPLLFAVAIVEPMLAFGRIGRVLIGRFAERRAVQQQQYEQAQREAEMNAPA